MGYTLSIDCLLRKNEIKINKYLIFYFVNTVCLADLIFPKRGEGIKIIKYSWWRRDGLKWYIGLSQKVF